MKDEAMNAISENGERIGDVLDAHAAAFPERIAIVHESRQLSWAELAREVDCCVRALLAAGLKRGDRIAVLSTPRPEVMITFVAAAKLGILWLGLNPRYRLPELQYVVSDAQPVLLFGIAEFEGRNFTAEVSVLAGAGSSIRQTICFDGDRAPYQASYAEWLASGMREVAPDACRAACSSTQARDPALLVYTSGSSGRPKGVQLQQHALVKRSRTQNERFPARDYPRVVNPLPINHIGGMHFLSLFALVGGGTVVLHDRFSAENHVRALREHDINVLIVLPTMLIMMMQAPNFSADELDRLEWVVFSGAAMPVETIEILSKARCKVGLTYGMTETCGSVTYSDPEATIETLANTIGRAAPEGETRVADDAGIPCAVGVPGEIQVRAEYCMGGYLNRPDATATAYTPDGWLRTGDSAVLRDDGNIRFIGRMSEMYKSGGYNVYPREVELAIEEHPAVALAAVVGVPDPLYNEVGWAYVVPASGQTVDEVQLKDWCRERLANYKVPKRFILRAELPLLPVGKVDKVGLRNEARALVDKAA